MKKKARFLGGKNFEGQFLFNAIYNPDIQMDAW